MSLAPLTRATATEDDDAGGDGVVSGYLLAGTAVVLAAAATAFLIVHKAGHAELVLPIAALAGSAFVALGLVRFEWFVLGVIAIRTAVDATKIHPATNQLASVSAPQGGNSTSAASALAILFIGVGAFWLVAQRHLARTEPATDSMAMTKADGAFAFFVASCLLSVVDSVNRSASVIECARIIAAVLMFVVLERLLTSMVRVRRVMIAAAVATVPPILFGLLQVVTGHGKFETAGLSRVIGTFLHPNTFGFFLSMVMLMGIAIYRYCSRRTRLVLIAGLIVCGGMFLLTYSRGSWVAFILGLILIGILQSRVVFAWLVGGGVVALAIPQVQQRITNLGAGKSVYGSSGNSLVWRFQYWSDVLHLNHNNPITGIGLKGTKYLTDQSKAPHNDFLRAFAETGVIGLLAFVVVIVSLVGVARRSLKQTQAAGGLGRGVAVGFSAVLIAYVIDSLGDNLMSEVVVLWYFYAFAACAYAVGRLAQSDVPVAATSSRALR